ncbi:MAG: GSCFA domain-containing protein [Bacteroidales bacterium]
MMDFRKVVEIPSFSMDINYFQKILSLGSCFADHIGNKLIEGKFHIQSNPFGVLYNPASILSAIKLLEDRVFVKEDELHESMGLWSSFKFHSIYSSEIRQQALDTMNTVISTNSAFFEETEILLITFGTAWVYELKETGEIVSNCHKLPAQKFSRRRLSVDEVVSQWSELLDRFFASRMGRNVIFTVSPIRHWKDGSFENQCSKATLILAIDQLCKRYAGCHYFPSYEIFMDELRDYRFYADDMIHPSRLGVEYVWERFSHSFFTKETKADYLEWMKIKKMIDHRPLNGMTESYRSFLKENLKRIDVFRQKRPYFDLNFETQSIKELCNTL